MAENDSETALIEQINQADAQIKHLTDGLNPALKRQNCKVCNTLVLNSRLLQIHENDCEKMVKLVNGLTCLICDITYNFVILQEKLLKITHFADKS